MSEMENKYIMYEYLEVKVKEELVEICSDCYHELGWSIINTKTGIDGVTLKMKRDRKIKNRYMLCELQRKCEDAFIAVERLEKNKLAKPMGVSLGTGLLGTAFLALSVFSYLAPNLLLCILFAIPGFIGWGSAYFLYMKLSRESTEKAKPQIEQNYDVIYEACEKARKLLE